MNETLQFPLPLLAYGKTYQERIGAAITYAVITTGKHRITRLSVVDLELELAGARILKSGNGITLDQVRALGIGDKFCAVMHHDAGRAFSEFSLVESFLLNWKSKGLTIRWTRIPSAMAFEAKKGSAENYQRFAALCAVNSIIGSKPYTVVTRPRVRAGMLGYSSGKLLFDEDGNLHDAGRALLAERDDPTPTIATRDQMPTLLSNLVKSQLVHRFYPGTGRKTYYSKKLSAEQIAEALVNKAKRNANTITLEAHRQTLKQIKEGVPLLSGAGNEKPPLNRESPLNRNSPTAPPEHPQNVPTTSPLNASSYATFNAIPYATRDADPPSVGVALKESEERKPVEKIEIAPTAVVLLPPVAPEVPDLETAIEFARTLTKRTFEIALVIAWLSDFAANPKADWRKSLSSRLLGRRHSR